MKVILHQHTVVEGGDEAGVLTEPSALKVGAVK